MGFTDAEIARYTGLIEKVIWSRRRPPLHLREKVREGQRIANYEIELFIVRPHWCDPSQTIKCSIAKTRFVKSRHVWRVFWKRQDMKWHRYDPRPEVQSLEQFLELVQADQYQCFWG